MIPLDILLREHKSGHLHENALDSSLQRVYHGTPTWRTTMIAMGFGHVMKTIYTELAGG